MIYEIHDPHRYLTPDVVADFSEVQFTEIGKDKVEVRGATGHPKTDTLKVSVGYKDCFIGEGEISYGGTGSLARAELAADIVKKRFELTGIELDEMKIDYIGMNATYWNHNYSYTIPDEVRLRVSGRTKSFETARKIGREVEALYTNGPAGGGGARQNVREIMSIASILIDRHDVEPVVTYMEV